MPHLSFLTRPRLATERGQRQAGGIRVASLLAVGLGLAGLGVTVAPTGASAAVSTARFVPLPPARILDTRDGTGGGGGRLGAGASVAVPVAAHGGVPAGGAVAVAFNLTAVDVAAAGYFTVSPTGAARPVVSNLNVTARGQTVANLVVVRLGAGGAVDLFSQSGGDAIIDVAGYWTEAAAATDGRFVPLKPARILDTREGNGAVGPVGPGSSIDVQVAGRGSVPATGASAVVLNLTATDSTTTGFVTAWPTGGTRPVASVLNLPGRNATVPNLVVVPLGAGGRISLFSQNPVDLIVDVAGWFTSSSSPSGTEGLFVPLAPARVLDTRDSGIVGAGQNRLLPLGGAGGVPATGVGSVVVNLTGAEALVAGYVTAYPAQTAMPLASNLNLPGPGSTVANAAFVTLGEGESIRLFSQNGTHLVVDVAGYFLGAAVPAEATSVALLRRPPTPEAFACNEVNGVGQVRVDINPGLIPFLKATVTPSMDPQAFRDVVYTTAVNSGPFPAIVASIAEWDTWVDNTFTSKNGSLAVADVFDAFAMAYHEVIHTVQSSNRFGAGVNCLPMAPAGGHRWVYGGFAQSLIKADVDGRIDALVTDPFLLSSARTVSDLYLTNTTVPGIANQGFESQLWEVNAYVLEMEWENAFGQALSGAGLSLADHVNTFIVSAKLHQLARYLTRAQSQGANFQGLQSTYNEKVVADLWNLAVANWRVPASTPIGLARDTWTLAFGADAAVLATFAPGQLNASPMMP